MPAKLVQHKEEITQSAATKASHILFILPPAKKLSFDFLGKNVLQTRIKRQKGKFEDLTSKPISADLPGGGLGVWIMLDETKSRFEQLSLLRSALSLLFAEKPQQLSIALYGEEEQRKHAAAVAMYVAWLNGTSLPNRKRKAESFNLEQIDLYGYKSVDGFAEQQALAQGNTLTRELTILPPNELNPSTYRKQIAKLAKQYGWQTEELDFKKLRKMGAGAFCAVAQGSPEQDAAIVHLTYRPKKFQGKSAGKAIALVGKGICFDTGGHNLKPARYMQGMHEDMNGSAVVLGILLAATQLKLPLQLDCWLAIAQNHISPQAYKQNEVVTTLNGTTIEIVHTDAEGRMVLSDTLTLAARKKPSLIIDFATLTGTCTMALGTRYSGVFSNHDEWLSRAVEAGKLSGERVSGFPTDQDYEPALDSKIADIKQCSMDGEADHILAACFLKRFIEDIPWLHMDLSASSSKEGLGAVSTEVTGFGVAWAMELMGKAIASRLI